MAHDGRDQGRVDVAGNRDRRDRFAAGVDESRLTFLAVRRWYGWDADGVTFYFGFKAMPNLEEIADNLPKTAWKKPEKN